MQADGNLVVYEAAGTPVWASGTAGHPGASLRVGDDGNMAVVTPAGATVWQTATCCR
jgi:hypothetical protein